MSEPYDIVVIGAGPSGAAVAARIAEATRARLCVLEAGPEAGNWRARSPGSRGDADDGLDWGRSSPAQDQLGRRRIELPAGRGLGGSELLAPPVWLRPAESDVDAWGIPGWSGAELGAALRAVEARAAPAPVAAPRPISRRFAEAEGAPATPPDPAHSGLGLLPQTLGGQGRRTCWDSLAAPLAAKGRIAVRTDSRVARILFRRWRAVGVELTSGERVDALGGVILCAGPLETPAVLMRSGVGSGYALDALGIPVAAHLEGVGQGLAMRPAAALIHEAPERGAMSGFFSVPGRILAAAARAAGDLRGPAAQPLEEAGGFLRVARGAGAPDLEVRLRLGALEGAEDGAPPGLRLEARLCRPVSRGRLALRGTDPRLAPRISPGLLTQEEDRAAMRAAIRRLRALFDREEFDGLRGAELRPGRKVQSEEALDAWLAAAVEASGEVSGGCAMGLSEDAPLDPSLRVRGIDGLWVCDSSAMPAPVSAGTRAAAAALGWHGGGMIVEQLRSAVHDAA